MAEQFRFVGIDVGKRYVDVAFGSAGKVEQFANDDEGIAKVLKRLEGQQVERIVLEASGGYQRQLLASLLGAKYPAVAVNPRQVRDFAKALGWLWPNGTPAKSKVQKAVDRLRASKMVYSYHGGKYRITKKGAKHIGEKWGGDDDE